MADYRHASRCVALAWCCEGWSICPGVLLTPGALRRHIVSLKVFASFGASYA
ncbi:hypothetical protein THIOKS11020007 [Thiocapsa sp. KS1]|nr:hypothetical protein THIOKS11020007 [Thiocapsa sp. KS1]